MARILVTGATGFIGRCLLDRLVRAGHDVTCLVRSPSKCRSLAGGVRTTPGDVLAPDSLRDAVGSQDVVYHLAGLVRARPDEMHRVNGAGTANVCDACAAQPNPPVLIVVSSLAVAGPANSEPSEPWHAPRPVSHYGRSKLAGEMAARTRAAHVPTTIVRPGIVFGEGDRFTLQWFQSIRRFGVHVVPGRRSDRFSLIYVDDLVEMLELAAHRGTRLRSDVSDGNGVYFAGHPHQPTYAEIGRLVGSALKRRHVAVHVPMCLLWGYGAAADVFGRLVRRPPWIGIDKVREAAAGSWVCSSHSAKELGIEFKTPLDEQFRQTAAWYRVHGLL